MIEKERRQRQTKHEKKQRKDITRNTLPKTNITKEKNIFFSSMFKNAQPYMLQFHVKESHIHFWTFLSRKIDVFFYNLEMVL